MDEVLNTVGQLCSSLDKSTLMIIIGISAVLILIGVVKRAIRFAILVGIICLLATGIMWIKDEVLTRNNITVEGSMISVNGTEFNLKDVESADIASSADGENSNIKINLKNKKAVTIVIPSNKVWMVKSLLENATTKIYEDYVIN